MKRFVKKATAVFVWTLLTTLLDAAVSPETSKREQTASRNSSNEAKVLEDLPNSSQFSCAASCKLSPRCQTVSFDKKTLRCLLLDGRVETPAGDDGKAGDPILISHVTEWPDSISGPCCARSTTCPNDVGCCWVDRVNRPHCRGREVYDHVTHSEGSGMSYLDVELTNAIKLRCGLFQSKCELNGDTLCFKNGRWQLNNYTTHIPRTPPYPTREQRFTINAPCPLYVGSTLEVSGTPLPDAKSNSVALDLGSPSKVYWLLMARLEGSRVTVEVLSVGAREPVRRKGEVGKTAGKRWFAVKIAVGRGRHEILVNESPFWDLQDEDEDVYTNVTTIKIASRLKNLRVRIGYPRLS